MRQRSIILKRTTPLVAICLLGTLAAFSNSFAVQRHPGQPPPDQQPAKPAAKMYAILLGTGFPRPDANRAGPSTAIVVGEKVFLVDAGRGVMQRIAGAGLTPKSIQAVFLTHLHSDHIDGLPDVFHSTWQFGRSTPFELYGPEGTQDVVDGMMKFYAADIHIRRDLTEKLPAAGATIDAHILKEGVVYQDAYLRVTAFLVDHFPVVPAFGFRFDTAGGSIAISGDTHPNDNLVRYAKGADILIHEAYLPQTNAPTDTAADGAWFTRYHSTAAEAGDDAARAGVKILVLTHLIPHRPGDSDSIFSAEAAKTFHGKIIVGHDLMRIDLPGAPR
ncbi:MAG: MBL fold metallo-hydrolase [Candidatus Acidiferrales bacterium]